MREDSDLKHIAFDRDLCLVLHPNFSNWEINIKNKSKGEMGLSQDTLTLLYVPNGNNSFLLKLI